MYLLNIVSQRAANFGSLLSGISALGCLVLAVYKYFTKSSTLPRERANERCYDIAERVLNDLDSFEVKIVTWIRNSIFVYKLDRKSEPIVIDEFEIGNYVKNGDKILLEFRSIKNLCFRLNNKSLDSMVDSLEKRAKDMISSLNYKHHSDKNQYMKNMALKIDMYKYIEDINNCCMDIRSILRKV